MGTEEKTGAGVRSYDVLPMRSRLLLFLALLLPVALAGAGPTSCWFSNQDTYHGWTGVQLAATGRFRVEQVEGLWWFVAPDGHAFFSAGVNNVSYCTDWAPALNRCPYQDVVAAKYGSADAWGVVTIEDEIYAKLFLRMWSVHLSMYEGRAQLAGPP
jgi:hypothetical protein